MVTVSSRYCQQGRGQRLGQVTALSPHPLLQFGGERPGSECCQLWHSAASPLLNMGHWGKAEDKRLLELARAHDNRNWEKIAAELQVCMRASSLHWVRGIWNALALPLPLHSSLPTLSPLLPPSCPMKTSRSPVQCLLRYQTFLNLELHKGSVRGVGARV